MPLSNKQFEKAVGWLQEQIEANLLVPELLEVFPETSVEDAYRLQLALIDKRLARGETHLGMKAALTNAAMQAFFNVNEPCAGQLTSSALFAEGDIAVGDWVLANVEPEIAFVLKAPLRGPGVTVADVKAATQGVRAAIEIGHLRTKLDKRSPQTALALNTFNGGVVLGESLVDPEALETELAAEEVRLEVDGQLHGVGTGEAVMGDPWKPVAWLANTMAAYDRGLEPGMFVISGSMLQSPLVKPGQKVHAQYTNLGALHLNFVS